MMQVLSLYVGLFIVILTVCFRLVLLVAMRDFHDKLSNSLASCICFPPLALGIYLMI